MLSSSGFLQSEGFSQRNYFVFKGDDFGATIINNLALFFGHFELLFKQYFVFLHDFVFSVAFSKEFEAIGAIHELMIGQVEGHCEHVIDFVY
jgi:hypothetical protein